MVKGIHVASGHQISHRSWTNGRCQLGRWWPSQEPYTNHYCWWLKSCTTWDVWNPINIGINYLSTGAGFLPSTVVSQQTFVFKTVIAFYRFNERGDAPKILAGSRCSTQVHNFQKDLGGYRSFGPSHIQCLLLPADCVGYPTGCLVAWEIGVGSLVPIGGSKNTPRFAGSL